MSASAEIALRAAARAALIADAGLAALVDTRIFDGPPRAALMPYVSFGDARLRDWSTSSDLGIEHLLAFDVWSLQPGMHEVLVIADLLSRVLQDTVLTLTDHRLVDLRFASLDTRREQNGRYARGMLRLRAVTETL